MILLDTHIWVWWVNGSKELIEKHKQVIDENKPYGLGLSVISCWEVAKLVEYGRLELCCTIEEWIGEAVENSGVQLITLTPQIAIESTKLPGSFHSDPADQIIAATSRLYKIPLVTVDRQLLNYPHIRTL